MYVCVCVCVRVCMCVCVCVCVCVHNKKFKKLLVIFNSFVYLPPSPHYNNNNVLCLFSISLSLL